MEQIPCLDKNSSEKNEEKLITITEDSEFHIIDTGTKKRYVPKWKYIPVNGVAIKTEKLVKALALYPEDNPAIALEKLAKEHPEIK